MKRRVYRVLSDQLSAGPRDIVIAAATFLSPNANEATTMLEALRQIARPMERATAHIQLSDAERATLVHWVRSPTTAQRLVLRSRIVLMLARGLSARRVARELGVARNTV